MNTHERVLDAQSLLRLSEDYSRASKLDEAVDLCRRALTLGQRLNDTGSIASALFKLSGLARLRQDHAASLHYAEQLLALDCAEKSAVVFKGYLALGQHYIGLGDDARVCALMLQAESFLSNAALSDLCYYFELRATAEARLGNKDASVRAYDTLLDFSERHDRPGDYVLRLSTAAANAASLGLMARAHRLHERAVSIAKQNDPRSTLAVAALSSAWTAIMAGEFARARSLFEAAELWPSLHLYARLLRAAVGVLLGCLSRDSDLVMRCLDLDILEVALSEAAVYRAGPVVAAAHEFYAEEGYRAQASALRARVMKRIEKPHGCWFFLLQVAMWGSLEDTARAVAILEPARASPLAAAHHAAVSSRLAQLAGDDVQQQRLAAEAAHTFDNLGWRYHEAVCLRMAGRPVEAQGRFRAMNARARYELVARGMSRRIRAAVPRTPSPVDREVAQLIARGATNRQIAERLGMAERTVKYHLTVIFNALGVRSRAEVAELIHREPNAI
jgi:DNA-binding CsgD family transcriptional regulator